MFDVDLMYNNRWAGFKQLRERWLAHVDDTATDARLLPAR